MTFKVSRFLNVSRDSGSELQENYGNSRNKFFSQNLKDKEKRPSMKLTDKKRHLFFTIANHAFKDRIDYKKL